MILVDTSVWIDHLHKPDGRLVSLLDQDVVGCHPMVIEELALGSLRDRARVLSLLGSLREFPELSHDEVMVLVEQRRWWGCGLSVVDAQLVGAVLLVPGGTLWTRDKRLQTVCREAGVAVA